MHQAKRHLPAQLAAVRPDADRLQHDLDACRAELAATVERGRQFEALAQLGTWKLDSTGRGDWSPGVAVVFRQPPDTSIQSQDDLYSRVHPDDRKKWESAARSCADQGVPVALLIRLADDDRTQWIQIKEKAVLDDDGRVLHRLGTCQDISQQMTREQEMQFIIQALNLGVWIYDPITSNLIWDDSMYSVFQIDPKDFSGTYDAWERSLTPEAKVDAVNALAMALSGEKDFDTTFQIATKSGELRDIGGKGIVVRNARGEPIRMYGLNWDRTHEVRLEKTLAAERVNAVHSAKMASLGEMAAGVAHEINNPLAILRGKAMILKRNMAAIPDAPPALTRDADIIFDMTTRIARIVKGLSTFSRSDVNDPATQTTARGIIDIVLGLCAQRFKSSGIDLQITLASDDPLICRETEITQVLLNLLNNAFDAVNRTGAAWVRLEVAKTGNDAVEFAVTDSGPGIKADIAAKIMQPFFTTKPVGKGTGLGLSISQGIAASHGGLLALDPNCPNTRFVLRLPTSGQGEAAASRSEGAPA